MYSHSHQKIPAKSGFGSLSSKKYVKDVHGNAKDSNAHKIAIFLIFDIKPALLMAPNSRYSDAIAANFVSNEMHFTVFTARRIN
jgi:hypothetical protein